MAGGPKSHQESPQAFPRWVGSGEAGGRWTGKGNLLPWRSGSPGQKGKKQDQIQNGTGDRAGKKRGSVVVGTEGRMRARKASLEEEENQPAIEGGDYVSAGINEGGQ